MFPPWILFRCTIKRHLLRSAWFLIIKSESQDGTSLLGRHNKYLEFPPVGNGEPFGDFNWGWEQNQVYALAMHSCKSVEDSVEEEYKTGGGGIIHCKRDLMGSELGEHHWRRKRGERFERYLGCRIGRIEWLIGSEEWGQWEIQWFQDLEKIIRLILEDPFLKPINLIRRWILDLYRLAVMSPIFSDQIPGSLFMCGWNQPSCQELRYWPKGA